MAGNLKLYLGAEAINHYAVFLREVGTPLFPRGTLLWVARLVLLAMVGIHMASAARLTVMAQAARPVGYTRVENVRSTYASRTMRWGGLLILLFVIYHLLHLTFGWVHPSFREGDVYHNVVAGFRVPLVAAFYVLANVALGMHLAHGLWSMFQTLGLSSPRFNPWRRTFANAFAAIVTIGNVSFPIAVLLGLVSE
ncbi:MAG: succinate dehydrogenase cytochrome b subunit [Acidobacteriota bacterium]